VNNVALFTVNMIIWPSLGLVSACFTRNTWRYAM